MAVSERVKASQLEEVDLETSEAPKPVNVAKKMQQEKKTTMIELLKEFNDLFSEDMRGLDPPIVPTSNPP